MKIYIIFALSSIHFMSASKNIAPSATFLNGVGTRHTAGGAPICGIYKITSPSGKIYIGQSNNILLRWHHYQLGRTTKQPKLHASIVKHGINKHKFEILQECSREELNGLEKYYVDLYQTFNSKYGLNIQDGGGHSAKRRIVENVEVFCACGCGASFLKYDSSGRERKYVTGHNPSVAPVTNAILICISSGQKTLSQILEHCIGASCENVKTILSRLVKEKQVARIGRALYAPIGTNVIEKVNPIISCECGCGNTFLQFDKSWRPRRFISGHNDANHFKHREGFNLLNGQEYFNFPNI